jgi:predicted Zn-dependent protease
MKALIEFVIIIIVGYHVFDFFYKSEPNLKFDIKSTRKTERRNTNSVDYYIRPLGNVDNSDLTEAVKYVEDFYGYNCKIASGVTITSTMKIDNTNDFINGKEAISELRNYNNTIFIVDKRLWNNNEVKGLTDGTTIIVRGEKGWLKETLIHEIGHTLGLGHCDNLSCIMAINNDEYETGTFCNKCKRHLRENKN